MTAKIFGYCLTVFVFIFATVAGFYSPACTPAQMEVARPLVRSGGLVCLAVPGEDREVCARATDLARAVFTALDDRGVFAAPLGSASAAAPPIDSAPPPEAGPVVSATPPPAERPEPQ